MIDHKKNFQQFFSDELNSAQQQAVKHHTGPLLVVAGAGSGKTRVITSRITHLILEQNVLPQSIVALTFTNKAAQEMKTRIARFLGNYKIMPFIGTFHSYCLQLLKTHPHLLKHPHFTILDDDDQHKMIGKIITRFSLGKKITAKQLAYQISKIKNSGITSSEHATEYPIEPMVHQVYKAYEQEKTLSNCFDFDDLLIEVLKLLQTNKDFKEQLQERVRHILVDEYQDTNTTQNELLKYMALTNKKKFAIDSLCAVGDEDQSIYSWRGATVAHIMNFKKDFPGAEIVTVEQNYRSAQPILETANHIIKNNQNRNPKKLWSAKKGSDRIRSCACLSGYQEADLIAFYIQLLAKISPLNSTAILYRAHYQSRTLEEALIKHSIAYRIIGGIQFYERAEIKDILAYLKLIANPFDRVSFFRVINTPARGLGEKFEELVYERWNKEPFLTFIDVCKKLIEEKLVIKSKAESLAAFIKVFDGLTHLHTPSTTTEKVIEKIEYFEYLKNAHDPEEGRTKIENVKELIQAIKHFEEQGKDTISAFLDDVALMQEKMSNKNETQEHVVLMTLHAAKGLEFDNVIICGIEEGLLPSSHAMHDKETLEEERRLLYVGITRTRERLLLTHARYRHTFGQMEHQIPSRFWNEIPHTLVKTEDCSHWTESQIKSYFSSWLNIKQQIIKSSVLTFGPSQPIKQIKEKEIVPFKNESILWRKNQPVKHDSFGVGIVQSSEKKGEDKIYVTVQFKKGIKKVDAKFLHKG